MASIPKFDVLTATAAHLQDLLNQQNLSSVDIVETYLAQIEAHNRQGLNLRAISAVAPRETVLERARELDKERKLGKVRSSLHGIPLIVKDAIVTGPELGMPTTAGTVAFETAVAKKNAAMIDRLMDAGMIILGKAGMSEYCGSHSLPAGYSASNGQIQSPYIYGGRREDDGIAGVTSPGGSSAGSGAGVAAGFVPLSIGTDTVGSVVLPTNRAALYTIKLPSDSVLMDGVFSIARGWDSLGPMAKSVQDLKHMMEVMQNRPLICDDKLEAKDKLCGLRIGAVDFLNWQPIAALVGTEEDKEQVQQEYKESIAKLADLGAVVKHPIPFTLDGAHHIDGKSHNDVSRENHVLLSRLRLHAIDAQGRENFEAFTAYFDSTPVRTVDELITFNEANRERAMPSPDASNAELMHWRDSVASPEDTAKLVERMKAKGKEVLDKIFSEFDVVILPADCNYVALASNARYPVGVVPLGYLNSTGMPQGLTIGAGQDGEATMLRFMEGFEANFPARRTPPQLQY